tara:strand:- start:401 stop:844 length:444 start_codon:yes stop_codon:yes gene_type:complete
MATPEIYTGRIKWFNNKAGYGFITVIDGPDSSVTDTDIFVHHTAIMVHDDQQYRYLTQGEYVELSLKSVDGSETHKIQAADVKGMKGGKLMCETRNDTRVQFASRSPRKSNQRRVSKKMDTDDSIEKDSVVDSVVDPVVDPVVDEAA